MSMDYSILTPEDQFKIGLAAGEKLKKILNPPDATVQNTKGKSDVVTRASFKRKVSSGKIPQVIDLRNDPDLWTWIMAWGGPAFVEDVVAIALNEGSVKCSREAGQTIRYRVSEPVYNGLQDKGGTKALLKCLRSMMNTGSGTL